VKTQQCLGTMFSSFAFLANLALKSSALSQTLEPVILLPLECCCLVYPVEGSTSVAGETRCFVLTVCTLHATVETASRQVLFDNLCSLALSSPVFDTQSLTRVLFILLSIACGRQPSWWWLPSCRLAGPDPSSSLCPWKWWTTSTRSTLPGRWVTLSFT